MHSPPKAVYFSILSHVRLCLPITPLSILYAWKMPLHPLGTSTSVTSSVKPSTIYPGPYTYSIYLTIVFLHPISNLGLYVEPGNFYTLQCNPLLVCLLSYHTLSSIERIYLVMLYCFTSNLEHYKNSKRN